MEFAIRVMRGRRDDGSYAVPNEEALILFASWLATTKSCSPNTIKRRLSAVATWVQFQGYPDPRMSAAGKVKSLLYACLRGIAKTRSTKLAVREALTTDKLRRFLRALERRTDLSSHDRACYAALLTLGVFGLFRVGELTTKKVGSFDPETVLRGVDVQLSQDWDQDEYLDVTLRASKTDICRRGITLRIYASGDPFLCPVRAYRRYLRKRGRMQTPGTHPLFVDRQGKFVTRDKVARMIRTLAELAGYDPTHFVTHSMRAGGATSLAMLGYAQHTIQLFGRWRSDCFIEYIKLAPSTMKGVAANLARLDEIEQGARRRLWLEFRKQCE